MNFLLPLLKIFKSPQTILIIVVIAIVGWLSYSYTSLQSQNETYASQIAVEARERALLASRYDALSESVKQQEQALTAYIEGLEDVRRDNESLKQQLQEIEDENIRQSLDTILPDSISSWMLNNGREND